MSDADHERLSSILRRAGYKKKLSETLGDLVDNLFEMDDHGELPLKPLTLRKARKS